MKKVFMKVAVSSCFTSVLFTLFFSYLLDLPFFPGKTVEIEFQNCLGSFLLAYCCLLRKSDLKFSSSLPTLFLASLATVQSLSFPDFLAF